MKALPVVAFSVSSRRSRFARIALALVSAAIASAGASAAPLLQVAANFGTTCAVVSGAAWCWGYNANGQLGNGSTTQSLVPAPVSGLSSGVAAITTSGSHSCAVVNGGAWCWGKNADGQLGDGTNVQQLVPVQVSGLSSGVTAISAGDDHTCAIVDGGVKCWGANVGYGQLGDGTSSASRVPVGVAGLGSDVTALSAGRQHTCALASGGAYCWGRADSGELGNGASPVVSRTPVLVSGGNGATMVDAGGSFACMVNAAGAACWGFGGQGQLGNGGSTGSALAQPVAGLTGGVTAIAAGSSYHACAIVNGALQCWGYNNAGQLGNPAAGGGTTVPIAVSGLGIGVVQAAAGGLHTCAATSAGLYCWGDNAYGQLGTGDIASRNTPVLVLAAPAGTTALLANPSAVGFSPQSLNTTSPPRLVTITNNGASTLAITDVSASAPHFAESDTCATLAPNASCDVTLTFTPAAAAALTGTLSVTTAEGTLALELAGLGERSLVAHYYRSILRRAPDTGGKAYWEAEAARVQALGVSVNEAWFALAGSFYGSGEYAAQGRDNAGYVTDMYNTFFNRAPDSAGLTYWAGLLASGMPREVVLASFMFSSEFATFTQAIFGAANTRKEIDTVVDFYRGILGRLPDDAGFAYWLQLFRTAQCQGAGAVGAQAESISSLYANSPEYGARNRSNAQFVGDMYNAFLRRGGDLAGVQYWIGQLDSGARSRENVRQNFVASPEFSARIDAVVAQGCLQ